LAFSLVFALGFAACAGALDFYHSSATVVGLFNNLTGGSVNGLILRFSGPIVPGNAVGVGASLHLVSDTAGELSYSGPVTSNGTWEVDWQWDGSRLEYAAWLLDGIVVAEIPVHNPTATFGIAEGSTAGSFQFFAPGCADPDGYPLARYLWQWSDGASADGETVERSFAPGKYAVTLTVWDVDGNPASRTATFTVWQPAPRIYTLAIDVSEGGSVTVDPDEAAYAYGEIVTLTAVPSEGAVFTGWGGAASGCEPSVMLKITGDTTVTASFGWPT